MHLNFLGTLWTIENNHKKTYTSLTYLSSYMLFLILTDARKFSRICETSIGTFAILDEHFEAVFITRKTKILNFTLHQNLHYRGSKISFRGLQYVKLLIKVFSFTKRVKTSTTFFPQLTQSDNIHFRFPEKISYKKLLLSSLSKICPTKTRFLLNSLHHIDCNMRSSLSVENERYTFNCASGRRQTHPATGKRTLPLTNAPCHWQTHPATDKRTLLLPNYDLLHSTSGLRPYRELSVRIYIFRIFVSYNHQKLLCLLIMWWIYDFIWIT